MEQWRIRVNDKYPAYISWTTFEQIQTMLHDNHAEYDRNKTRGTPRPGKALLHGLVSCGACGGAGQPTRSQEATQRLSRAPAHADPCTPCAGHVA
jgi:hypothetical protein